MIFVHEGFSANKMTKAVRCPNCNHGRLGNMPEWSTAKVSPRGKPPPGDCYDFIQVKCPNCRKLWAITIE